MAVRKNLARTIERPFSLSLIHSAMMSTAPAIASAGDSTSSVTNLRAVSMMPVAFWAMIILARGSSPRSRAIDARVRRLGL